MKMSEYNQLSNGIEIERQLRAVKNIGGVACHLTTHGLLPSYRLYLASFLVDGTVVDERITLPVRDGRLWLGHGHQYFGQVDAEAETHIYKVEDTDQYVYVQHVSGTVYAYGAATITGNEWSGEVASYGQPTTLLLIRKPEEEEA